jgi:ribosomal protein S18 acetylase RimI-like enzyme
MAIRLETMLPAQLPEVLQLWRTTESIGLNESDTVERLGAYLLRNPGLSRVACVLDEDAAQPRRIVGAILCGHDGRRGYLHHLAVAPEFRRRGIGSRLVSECLAELALIDISRCNLFAFAGNAAGQSFWLAGGWRLRGELCLLQRQTLPVPADSTRLEPTC